MTRINAGIPPANLTDQHLLAEHREITRVWTLSRNRNPKCVIPAKFTLGKGHVIFFYDKHMYTYIRYKQLYRECIKRGFNVQNYCNENSKPTIKLFQLCMSTPYEPAQEDASLIKARITERIKASKTKFRYYGKVLTKEECINLLDS
jgi:deoxyribonuclease (pyrimidine dimer)